jgi:hypothetical protein
MLGGSDPLAEYERYLSLELPRRVRDRLESAVLGATEPLVSQIRSQLVDIVRTVQSEIFQSYQQSTRPQAASQSEEPETQDPNHSLGGLILDADTTFSYDMSAWAQPPSLSDMILELSLDQLPLQSSNINRIPDIANFADSGYGSQRFTQVEDARSLATQSTRHDNFDWPLAQDLPPEPSGPKNSQ